MDDTIICFRVQRLEREPLDPGEPPRLIMSLIFLHQGNYELAQKCHKALLSTPTLRPLWRDIEDH